MPPDPVSRLEPDDERDGDWAWRAKVLLQGLTSPPVRWTFFAGLLVLLAKGYQDQGRSNPRMHAETQRKIELADKLDGLKRQHAVLLDLSRTDNTAVIRFQGGRTIEFKAIKDGTAVLLEIDGSILQPARR